MSLANDVLATFMAVVATVSASVQFERRQPPTAMTRNRVAEEKVFEQIKAAIERTEQATSLVQATMKPSTTLTALSLRDGLGHIRSVLLLNTEVPKLLQFARTAGIVLSPAAAGVQMLEFSLRFADVDFHQGVTELAFRTSDAERARAKRGESSSGNINQRRALEELFRDER